GGADAADHDFGFVLAAAADVQFAGLDHDAALGGHELFDVVDRQDPERRAVHHVAVLRGVRVDQVAPPDHIDGFHGLDRLGVSHHQLQGDGLAGTNDHFTDERVITHLQSLDRA